MARGAAHGLGSTRATHDDGTCWLVALAARDASVWTSGEREATLVLVETGGAERPRIVTRLTLREPRVASVVEERARRALRVARVTVDAVLGRARELSIALVRVALLAGQEGVSARERKARATMRVDGET